MGTETEQNSLETVPLRTQVNESQIQQTLEESRTVLNPWDRETRNRPEELKEEETLEVQTIAIDLEGKPKM
jgi:hypothetical protein